MAKHSSINIANKLNIIRIGKLIAKRWGAKNLNEKDHGQNKFREKGLKEILPIYSRYLMRHAPEQTDNNKSLTSFIIHRSQLKLTRVELVECFHHFLETKNICQYSFQERNGCKMASKQKIVRRN